VRIASPAIFPGDRSPKLHPLQVEFRAVALVPEDDMGHFVRQAVDDIFQVLVVEEVQENVDAQAFPRNGRPKIRRHIG